MSPLLTTVVVVVVVLALISLASDWLKDRRHARDLAARERRDAHGGLYPLKVVRLAVYGAVLLTADASDALATTIADDVARELRDGVVYDGHRCRELTLLEDVPPA